MRKGKILVVEDDSDIREGVRILLESEEYEVIEAENGVVGLKLLDETIDLVILDIMMPGMDGITALTAIRRRIRENGQFVVAVEPNPGTTQMSLKVVQTPDGRAWWYAFTSFCTATSSLFSERTTMML